MENNENSLEAQRHSGAHLLALAIQNLYPDTKFGIGPAIENGFYYDFEFKTPLSADDLPKIEKEMQRLQNQKLTYSGKDLSIDEAKSRLEKTDQPYKLALLNKFAGEGEKKVSFYTTGDFTDLCKGGHVTDTSEIGPYKLTHLAGAYWLGDEKNPMLTRIYAAQFQTQAELDDYLTMQEEAKLRDHRKLGRELDLFVFSDLVGSGLPMFTPKGNVLRTELTNFLRSLIKPSGYQEVWIPHITKRELYEKSGHWDKFKDDLFHVKGKGKEEFAMKPMNCPHHNQIYASNPRSYRDLPIKYAEFTTNYRDELPGELSGLTRVRSLTQDDGHIYCRMDQVEAEIINSYEMVKKFYSALNLDFKIRLSTRNVDSFLGSVETWDKAENILKDALKAVNSDYLDGTGEAAFYGPKLDIMVTDALKRNWQVATIQLDFVQPERFNLTYTDENGADTPVVMIHRAICGSLERFIAILIEHYKGIFPLWLAPVQVAVLPVSEKVDDYAKQIFNKLLESDIRVVLLSTDSLGKRLRQTETEKIPLSLIIGEKEVESQTVSARSLKVKDLGQFELDKILEIVNETIKTRTAPTF